MDVRIGWAKFDAASPDVRIGWAQFDVQATPFHVALGWAEFDARAPTLEPAPPFVPGGGVARYHSDAYQKYEIPVDVDEDEEEQIILAVLMEVAAHVVL